MREDITKSTSSEEVGDVTASVEDSLQKKSSDNENVYEIAEPSKVYETAWSKKMIVTAYIVLFFTAFVESFAADSTKNLDSYATSSFNAHSLLATIAVVYKITAICAYPVFAKVADILGRGEGFGAFIHSGISSIRCLPKREHLRVRRNILRTGEEWIPYFSTNLYC